jgi:Cdc6-like AAA superfamily ATPase
MKFDPAVIVAITALVGSLGGIFLTNRYAARAARAAQEAAEKQKTLTIDSESFRRARDNYDAALAEQQHRIDRLRAEMKTDRDEYKRDTDECRQKIAAMRRDLTNLREWSRPLLRAARAAGVVHPEPPVWLGDTDPGMGSLPTT